MLKSSLPIGLFAALLVPCLPGPARATIVGTNSVLDDNGGSLYIPFSRGASGTLGDGGAVGLTSDRVRLRRKGATSGGYVSFVLDFDLSPELPGGWQIEQDSAEILLTLCDFDFAPDVYRRRWVLRETLEATFLTDADDTPNHAPDVVLNATNYESYAVGESRQVVTDNRTVTYRLKLKDDLGVTADQFAAIAADREFALFITLHAKVEHTRRSFFCGDRICNTPEQLSASFQFEAVPEPATLATLTAGALILAAHRRRTNRSDRHSTQTPG